MIEAVAPDGFASAIRRAEVNLDAALPWDVEYRCQMATQADVLRYLDLLRSVIEGAGEGTDYSEGTLGAVLRAMVAVERDTCPDGGDFSHVVQQFEEAVELAREAGKRFP